MRRCMRKCRGNAVPGAAELGVRVGARLSTRGRTRAPPTAAKISKVVARRRFIMRSGSECVELRRSRRRRRVVIAAGENDLQANSSDSESCCVDEEAKFSSRVWDHGDDMSVAASWCSSNSSTAEMQQRLDDDLLAVTGPEKSEHSHAVAERPRNSNSISYFRNRRETAPSNESKTESADDGMDSTAVRTSSESKYPCTRSTTSDKMPPDYEIEEFFAAAEKNLQKRFIEKYNFDIVRDVPLEGRYRWVPVKP